VAVAQHRGTEWGARLAPPAGVLHGRPVRYQRMAGSNGTRRQQRLEVTGSA
jgi:hypothetical protein